MLITAIGIPAPPHPYSACSGQGQIRSPLRASFFSTSGTFSGCHQAGEPARGARVVAAGLEVGQASGPSSRAGRRTVALAGLLQAHGELLDALVLVLPERSAIVAETDQGRDRREDNQETPMTIMTVSGHTYDLDPQRVENALREALPEPIYEHFVVINGRRWPPKQVLALVTGLDRADFTTHQARRALTRLGFTAARAARRQKRHLGDSASAQLQPVDARSTAAPQSPAEALRPFIGQWVAVRGDEVLVAADSPKDIVYWLARHQQQAQSVFRVPESEQLIRGAAPQ
jgi:hypothetical protein